MSVPIHIDELDTNDFIAYIDCKTRYHGDINPMASLTIRNIDDSLKATLRMSAAANQRSMEEEARQILKRHLLQRKCAEGIGTRIAERFSKAGGIELPQVPRSLPRQSNIPSNDS